MIVGGFCLRCLRCLVMYCIFKFCSAKEIWGFLLLFFFASGSSFVIWLSTDTRTVSVKVTGDQRACWCLWAAQHGRLRPSGLSSRHFGSTRFTPFPPDNPIPFPPVLFTAASWHQPAAWLRSSRYRWRLEHCAATLVWGTDFSLCTHSSSLALHPSQSPSSGPGDNTSYCSSPQCYSRPLFFFSSSSSVMRVKLGWIFVRCDFNPDFYDPHLQSTAHYIAVLVY